MTYKENITAILECYFAGFKKEIIDSACNRILEQEPKFIARPDGTIEQIENCNDCLFKKEWEKIGKLLSVVLEKQTEQEPSDTIHGSTYGGVSWGGTYKPQEHSRDMEEIAEIMKCDADAETKCKMVSNILTSKPHYFEESKTEQFAEWVAREIFDDMWEYNKDAFAEIACRKLAKLGIVRAKGDEWELADSQESEVSDADSN